MSRKQVSCLHYLSKVTKLAIWQGKINEIMIKKMICFDKMKITTSIGHIKYINETEFQHIYKNGELQQLKYRKTKPYELLMLIDYEKNEVAIEFTSKILEGWLIELINEETIYRVFDKTFQLVDFQDYEYENFEVGKCDIVQDISPKIKVNEIANTFNNKTFTEYEYVSMDNLKQYAAANLSNFDKWKCKKYKNNGFVIENVVSTPRYKHRIAIYNKGKELKCAKNREFVKMIDEQHYPKDPGSITDYYSDKTRVELNIITRKQIRELLQIQDNKLSSVLNSTANPILTVLNKALAPLNTEKTPPPRPFKEYLMWCVFKDCDFDLAKVEAKIRSGYSKNTQISKIMKPYREFYERMQNVKDKGIDIRTFIE